MKKNNKKHRKIIIIILLFSINCLTLYSIIKKQYAINELQWRIIQYENSNLLNLSVEKININPIKFNSGAIHVSKLTLVWVLRDCEINEKYSEELYWVKELYKKYKENVYIFVIKEKESSSLREFGVSYKYIAEYKEIMTPSIPILAHISFLIDKNGVAQSYYIALPGKNEKTNEYYRKVLSLFQSVYEN